MMLLPSLADLNTVSQLMHGLDFTPLPKEFKPGVVAIAQQGVLAYALDDLPTQISIGFAETVQMWPGDWKLIAKQLGEIDASLEPLMTWFRLSKLWEGH